MDKRVLMMNNLKINFKVTNKERLSGMINDINNSLKKVSDSQSLQDILKDGIEKANTQEEAEYFIEAFLDNFIQMLECYNIWSARGSITHHLESNNS